MTHFSGCELEYRGLANGSRGFDPNLTARVEATALSWNDDLLHD